MSDFLHGATSIAFVTVALYFLRFWQRSRDQLFLFFSFAFVILALGDLLFATAGSGAAESRPLFYLPRLAGNVLILVGIGVKNRGRRGASERGEPRGPGRRDSAADA